jgi:hypothetical protein
MIQLVEKKSRAQRLKEVSKLAEGDPAKLLQFINEEVKLAYLAGYYKFNGLTHDVEKVYGNTVEISSWSSTNLDDHEVGPDSLLPSLYSQSKGFE